MSRPTNTATLAVAVALIVLIGTRAGSHAAQNPAEAKIQRAMSAAPPEIARCWSEDYPDMGDAESCKDSARDCGYQLLGDFVLPPAAWWEYYTPMEQRLRLLARRYAGDPFAESVLRESAKEIENYRNYGTYYGYLFMVMAPKA